MRILYIVQQSVYNNKGRWVSADSNPMMVSGIVDQLLKKTDWDIDIMIAPIETFADISDYNQLLIKPNSRVNFISRPGPISAFTNRYHFDVGFFEKIFTERHYDIVINNIIELSRNIKTVLYGLNQSTKLVVGNYWVDCPMLKEEKVPLDISYDWRQIDGAECADLVSFTCKSTKEAFLTNCLRRMNIQVAKDIDIKSTIWDFGFSAYELDRYRGQWDKFEKKTILFPSRLSLINYTHHEEFIKAVNKIYERRKDFQVIFTNPSQKISWECLKSEVNPLYFIQDSLLDRRQYINLLWESDIIVSLYSIERYGGCANVEGIYCENYPVTTEFGEYLSRVEKNHPFVKLDLSNLEEVLDKALDICRAEPKEVKEYRKQLVYKKSSYEEVSNIVIKDIEELLSLKAYVGIPMFY